MFSFAVFSGTAHELIVPVIARNTHPRTHLIQREPTDLLNFPRRWTISGFQNATLYYKIDIVIQLFWRLYKWSLAQGLYKTLDPLFLFQIEPEISTPEISGFVMSVSTILVTGADSRISIVLLFCLPLCFTVRPRSYRRQLATETQRNSTETTRRIAQKRVACLQ